MNEDPLIRIEDEGGIVGFNLTREDLVDVDLLVKFFGEEFKIIFKIKSNFVKNNGKIKTLMDCIEMVNLINEKNGSLKWFLLFRPEFNRSPLQEIAQGSGRKVKMLLEQLM